VCGALRGHVAPGSAFERLLTKPHQGRGDDKAPRLLGSGASGGTDDEEDPPYIRSQAEAKGQILFDEFAKMEKPASEARASVGHRLLV
jgi:hypothetical protein